MNPVISIKLAMAPVEELPGFGAHTDLLSGSHRFATHIVLGFCAPDVIKGPDVSGIFNEVPAGDQGWTLEIAVELADLLPSLDGKSEAVVAVRTSDGVMHDLCLSNRMSRFHYDDQGSAYHALLPRKGAWHGAVHVQTVDGQTAIAAEEQLRTVAAMRFEVAGGTAEHAFESSIRDCLDSLFSGVNAVLHATRECQRGAVPTIRYLRDATVPSVYVLMKGAGVIAGRQLALSGAKLSRVPSEMNEDASSRFRALAAGSEVLSDVDLLLGEARSSCADGEYEFAFLQAVIAAEIATARAVRSQCLRRGVSQNKLKDLRKEMSYSLALNVHLPLSFPAELRPAADLIQAMNNARSKRNDLMHEGTFDLTRQDVQRLLTDTHAYINALKRACPVT